MWMDLWEWAQSVILEAILMPSVRIHYGKVTKEPKKEVVLVSSCQPASVMSHSNAGTMGSLVIGMMVGRGCV